MGRVVGDLETTTNSQLLMFNPPTLSEAMRVADNKHKYLQMTGTPMDRVNWLDAEQQAQQMQPAPPPTMPMPSGGPPSTGSRFGAMPMPMQSFPTPGKLIQPTGYANGGPVNRSVAPIGSSAVGTGPPGSFWDEKTKSWVVGINTAQGRGNYLRAVGGNTASGGQVRDGVNYNYDGSNARFGMGGGMQPGMTIGGGVGSKEQGAGSRNLWTDEGQADPFSTDSVFVNGKYVKRFAGGGAVQEFPQGLIEGPGGPKDDLIPAMLSDGEYIMPAEAVKFFGIDRLNKMKQKAMEGMEHMGKESEKEPDDMVSGYANGGPVTVDTIQGLNNVMGMPPRFVPAAPPSLPAPTDPSVDFSAPTMGFTPNKGVPLPDFSRVPDPVAPSLPTVDDMRFRGLAARAAIDNAPPSTIPNPPSAFMAPWERDAQAAAARDAASGRPEGMRKTDWRRMQADPKFILAQQGRQDRAAEMDMAARTRADERMVDWQRQQAMSNQAIGLEAARQAAQQQQRTDERTVDWQRNEAARNQAIGLDAARQTQTEQARKDELAIRRNYDLADRNMQIGAEAALYGAREDAKASRGPQIKTSPKMDPKVGVQFNVMDDGTRVPARVPNPTDTDKLNYLRYFENKPELTADQMKADDWVRAWHYATSGAAPVFKPVAAAAPASKLREFANTEEAMKAGLKPGDRVMVGGRAATWK